MSDEKAEKYIKEYIETITKPNFSNLSTFEKQETIGDFIYSYIEEYVGEEYIPKVTGMIIDLEINYLLFSVSSLKSLLLLCDKGVELIKVVNLITVKPFVQSPLNDLYPFDFGRGIGQRILVFWIFYIFISSFN